ncbi:MAG: N-acetyltransferase [Caldilineaceae bacterium]|nr:N-acetyltransferase [Caldilineaceae bacterium]
MSVVLRSRKMDDARAWPIIHPTADVSPSAQIGAGTVVWHRAHVREYARIGANCVVGKDAFIDFEVHIGDNVQIQNGAMIYHGAWLDHGVYIGPHACLTNDRTPRAIMPNGTVKPARDCAAGDIRVHYGASIGAGAILLARLVIGRFAMVGAGAVVTHDVPDYGIVVGVPARLIGFSCACGHRLTLEGNIGRCTACGSTVQVAATAAGIN